jgi:hypothetical protein
MKSPLPVLFASLLGACSNMSPDTGANPAGLQSWAQPPPRNYRQIIADELSGAFKVQTAAPSNQQADAPRDTPMSPIGTQVSELRKTSGPQMGDWMACLRVNGPNNVLYVAVFFEDGKILNYRTAVVIDQCPNATYGPLPRPMPKQKDQPAKKQ